MYHVLFDIEDCAYLQISKNKQNKQEYSNIPGNIVSTEIIRLTFNIISLPAQMNFGFTVLQFVVWML